MPLASEQALGLTRQTALDEAVAAEVATSALGLPAGRRRVFAGLLAVGLLMAAGALTAAPHRPMPLRRPVHPHGGKT
ncbi:MAG: hypothetical protein U5L74_05880 [Ideonella sp.]|nr:hypothetical protein [Ideonella sp.]